MVRKKFEIVRHLEIFDFLPGYGGSPSSTDYAEKRGTAEVKPLKSSRAKKQLEPADECLRDGTPFEEPSELGFASKSFCLTGKFAFGRQTEVSEIISELGGSIHKRVTEATDYLIVGGKANKNWMGGSYGLKIKKAVSRKLKGFDICLIQEEYLISSFPPELNPWSGQVSFEEYGLENASRRRV